MYSNLHVTPSTSQQNDPCRDDEVRSSTDEQPAAKRLKPEEASTAGDGQDHEQKQPRAPLVSSGGDQVAAAVSKIRTHICKPAKFIKASGLFRQLLDNGSITSAHHYLIFETVRAAFHDTKQVSDAQLRREYMRLMRSIENLSELFSKGERAQLEVYKIYAHLLNELFTDDSFMFSKVANRIKELIASLPAADVEDDAILQATLDQPWSLDQYQEPTIIPPSPPRSPPAEDPEADPFGLDALLAAPQPKPKVNEPPSNAWSTEACLCMRRQALVECLLASKEQHKKKWAQTTVELMIEHVHQNHLDKFCKQQQEQVGELMRYVKQQRMLRKQGKASEANRDKTSFDLARAEWANATVSHRGKVGGGGDHKNENWLG